MQERLAGGRDGGAVRVPPEPVDPRGDAAWTWDPSLYAGSAAHYAAGRVPYPREVADALVSALGLDGSGRLLDVGCGPGSLTLLLAPHFAEVIGVDADADMLAEAAELTHRARLGNATWRHLRAEDLPAGIPPVRVVTFAQSFHWMDRARVARTVRRMLTQDGAVARARASCQGGRRGARTPSTGVPV